MVKVWFEWISEVILLELCLCSGKQGWQCSDGIVSICMLMEGIEVNSGSEVHLVVNMFGEDANGGRMVQIVYVK